MKLTFVNPGELDLAALDTFGASVKEKPNSIGYFGTGLKFAVATLLRNGADVELHTSGGKFNFSVGEKSIRGQSFPIIYMNDKELPFTTNLGVNWEPWMAIREIFSNALDEGGRMQDTDLSSLGRGETAIIVCGLTSEQITPYFLELNGARLLYEDDAVDIYDARSDWAFYQGFAALKLPKPAALTYNFKRTMKLSEDRMIANSYAANSEIADLLLRRAPVSVLRLALTSGSEVFEDKLDFSGFSLEEDRLKAIQSELDGCKVQNETLRRHLKNYQQTVYRRSHRSTNELDDVVRGFRKLQLIPDSWAVVVGDIEDTIEMDETLAVPKGMEDAEEIAACILDQLHNRFDTDDRQLLIRAILTKTR